MKITIITVCLNSVYTIESTILSVVGQSYTDIEYIVIDGKSTDGTQEIIRKYETKIAYWISEQDMGIYDAMNKALGKATGDIVAFINSGDRYVKGALAYVADYFANNPSTEILCCEVAVEENDLVRKRNNALTDTPEKILLGHMVYSHQGIFAKRNLFEKYGSFNVKYKIASDYQWLLTAYCHGTNMRYSEYVTTIFLLGGISTTKWMESVREAHEIAIGNAKNLLDVGRISIYEYENLYHQIKQTISKRYVKAVVDEKYIINKEKVNKKMIQELFANNKCSLFGAGVFGKACLCILKELGIVVECFWDNLEAKWGKYVEGIPVRNPKEILANTSFIIISSQFYDKAIAEQLREMGLEKGRSYLGADVLYDIIKDSLF